MSVTSLSGVQLPPGLHACTVQGNDALLDALAARRGIVCLVGAGGKKSTMYSLALAHGGRVALTSSVHMHPYDRRVVSQVVDVTRGGDGSGPKEWSPGHVRAFVNPGEKRNRHGGLCGDQITTLAAHSGADLVLVKADGARGRLIKAPAAHEPVLPAQFETLIPVVSARVFGRRLDDRTAHRPELLAPVMGIECGEVILPRHVARLIASTEGSLCNAGCATTVVPLLNMVDTPGLLAQARECARLALLLQPRLTHIVLGAMGRGVLVETVRRCAR